jgi:hypothetical protein
MNGENHMRILILLGGSINSEALYRPNKMGMKKYAMLLLKTKNGKHV